MEHRKLGETDLDISRLGIGLAEIGMQLTSDQTQEAGRVLNAALDAGITFLDTSGCYGVSEELIGNTVSHRRAELVLASKTGHLKDGCDGDSWGYECVTASVERSLRRLKTDHIDLMQLHSCDVATLERGDAIRAIEDARVKGWIDYLGYSGDNDAALWAAESGIFDVIQTSFNIVDQGARRGLLDAVRERNLGLIAKRPIANGVWATNDDPDAYANGYSAKYYERQQEMRADGPLASEPDDRILASLGFTLSHPEVTVAIVGSKNPAHVTANIALLDKLPLNETFIRAAHERFDQLGEDWSQLT